MSLLPCPLTMQDLIISPRVLEELRKEMFLYAKDCVTDGRRESNSLYSVYPVTNLREHSTGSSSTQLKTLPPLVFMAS